MAEPVVIEWKEIGDKLATPDLKKLRLIDEKSRSISFQIDDQGESGMMWDNRRRMIS